MRWNFKPVSLIKKTAASLSVVTMCIAPVAQGAAAENQKKLINEYLKETGLTTKKMTVGEFWRMTRHVYPHKLQTQIDTWVKYNRNELMPQIEASTFKDANGVEQVRLLLTQDGKTTQLTFTGDEDIPVKINKVGLSKKELLNYNNFNDLARKISTQDTSIGNDLKKSGPVDVIGKQPVMTFNEFKKLSVRQRAEYLIQIRETLEAVQDVFAVRGMVKTSSYEVNDKYDYVLNFLFGQPTIAAGLTGQPCIVAGYISKYGEDQSCGGGGTGRQDYLTQQNKTGARCSGMDLPCNPLVYGFDGSGNTYCVPRRLKNEATANCNQQSPLNNPQDKKRIIESYMKKVQSKDVDLKLNEKGEISKEQYAEISGFLTDVNGLVARADSECGMVPLKNTVEIRPDQKQACEELRKRAVNLQTFAVDPVPHTQPEAPPPAVPNNGNCAEQVKGSHPSADGKSCECGDGEKVGKVGEPGREMQACVVGGGGAGAGGEAKNSCGFWCRNKSWIIPVGVGVLALGLFWWLFSKDKKKSNKSPEYVPPAPVPEPGTTTPTTPTTPVVNPPPPAPCPSPNTLVNGICTQPVVVPPPTTTVTEGGTKTETPGRAGGVR